MKSDAVMKMKNIGQRIGNFPVLRQPRSRIQVGAAHDQVVEKQTVDALRLRVDSDSRVQIRGARFDHHHQRVGIGLVGAGKQGKRDRKRYEQ